MKSKVQLKKNKKRINRLIKKFEELGQESLEVGHFEEQGKHSSGMSYPELMQIHEHGLGVPKRPVFNIAKFKEPPKTSPTVKKFMDNWMQSNRSSATKNLLDNIGTHYRDLIKSIFGDIKELKSNSPYTIKLKGKNSPLIESGDLRDKVKYKSSKNRGLK